jgi:DNA-binding beta-propeller fold protein YncE
MICYLRAFVSWLESAAPRLLQVCLCVVVFPFIAKAGTIFLAAYPDRVLVVDEATQQVIDTIETQVGLPTGMRLSYDRKKLYITTGDNNGVAVIDIATRKVINHFTLKTDKSQFRFNAVGPDPEDKLLYTVITEVTRQSDRFEVGKPKYAVIDLEAKKISRTVDIPPEDAAANTGFGRGALTVSPDGKYLYQFRDSVVILETATFKVIDRIELARPEFPGLSDVGIGQVLQSLNEKGFYTSLFNALDPAVRRRMFGIARFDLNSREFQFSPIGPTPDGMLGLEVAPDRKTAYTVVSNGEQGLRKCEFWAFDLGAKRRTMTSEFPCRPRFSFGMSSTGKELYIYGAGFEIEVYDAATLKLKRVTDLKNDVTMGGIVVIP